MKNETPKRHHVSNETIREVVSKVEEIEGHVVFSGLLREMPDGAKQCRAPHSSSTPDEEDNEEAEGLFFANSTQFCMDQAHLDEFYYCETVRRDDVDEQGQFVGPEGERMRQYSEKCASMFRDAEKASPKDAEKVRQAILDYKRERREIFDKKIKDVDPRIREVFIEFYDLFDGDLPNEWNALRVKPIKLPLNETLPDQIKPAYRPVFDDKQLEIIEDFIITSLGRKIIRKSTSNFMSNIHLVKRPEITPGVVRPMRLTIDYRDVNKRAMASAPHPIPEIGDVTARLGNKRIYTSVDISNR